VRKKKKWGTGRDPERKHELSVAHGKEKSKRLIRNGNCVKKSQFQRSLRAEGCHLNETKDWPVGGFIIEKGVGGRLQKHQKLDKKENRGGKENKRGKSFKKKRRDELGQSQRANPKWKKDEEQLLYDRNSPQREKRREKWRRVSAKT